MRLESAGGALVGKDHVAEPIVQDTALHVRVDGQTLIARCALPCLAAAPGSEQVQGRVVVANAGMGLEGATKGRGGLRSRRRRGRGPTGLLVAEEIGEGESLVGVGVAARRQTQRPQPRPRRPNDLADRRLEGERVGPRQSLGQEEEGRKGRRPAHCRAAHSFRVSQGNGPSHPR